VRTKARQTDYSAAAVSYPPSLSRLPSAFLPALSAVLLAACATGAGSGEDDGNSAVPDASPDVRPDAAPPIDAAPPVVDAAPVDAPPSAVDCTPDTTIACGQLLEHSLFFADGTMTGYSCEVEDTTGVENIYEFVPATSGTVTITLDVLEDEPIIGDDFDLYVLEDVCGLSSCATQSAALGDETLSFTATGGTTYYIVVEAFAAGLLTLGNYDLSVACL